MSILDMTEEEKNELREKHRQAIKADRENRDAMNGIMPKKKEEEKKKED